MPTPASTRAAALEAEQPRARLRAPSGLALQFGQDPEITALMILGLVQQRLGRIDAGGDKMRAALKKAEAFGHPLTYAYVLRHF